MKFHMLTLVTFFCLFASGEALYDKEIILLPAQNGKVVTKTMDAVKLEYGVKYLLCFQAKIDGPDKLDVMKENLRLPSLYYIAKHGNYNRRSLPHWQLNFLDSEGKTKAFGMRIFNDVIWDEWQDCTEVFYLPYGMESFQLVLENPNSENSLLFRNFTLGKVDEGAININPDFRYGEFGYTGYTGDPRKDQIGIGMGRLKRQEDGTYAMTFIKGGTRTSNFPVREKQAYRLGVDGENSRTLQINFVDRDGNVFKTMNAQPTYDFISPPGAVEAFIRIDYSIIKHIKMNEIE